MNQTIGMTPDYDEPKLPNPEVPNLDPDEEFDSDLERALEYIRSVVLDRDDRIKFE
jgi:hypothetical protein